MTYSTGNNLDFPSNADLNYYFAEKITYLEIFVPMLKRHTNYAKKVSHVLHKHALVSNLKNDFSNLKVINYLSLKCQSHFSSDRTE